ncbi:MAG TPA: type I polyketide synthase [Bryobacteraceae bacterium]|nr:type I polyketide synthase [Bryobacteraceae bacterium]
MTRDSERIRSPEQNSSPSPVKRALVAIEKLQKQLEAAEYSRREPVAIIGMGCRFPGGANTPERFWQLLRDGVDTVREVPKARWDIDSVYDPDPGSPGKMNTQFGTFLDDDIETFDAGFFGISPREAITLDPQQRLLLEVSWEALEYAGIVPGDLLNSATGVFFGIDGNDFESLLAHRAPHLRNELYSATGNALSVAAGRLSYTLGLRGPSLALDTACSSSLVAVHQAVRSLRNRECDLALAGGVNLILTPDLTVTLCKAGMLSPDGRCRTFDASANGYVRGDGCGVVTLKRLSDALAAGDTILAVIRGSMINHDGRSSGLTAPSGPSQQAVIRAALADAHVEPGEVFYVEAHGTGTALGDPIEIGALDAVFGGRGDPLYVGSVKTNIGHVEGAAGIAGLMKVVLAMQNGQIPPSLHFRTPNPYIAWNGSPVRVPVTLVPWPEARRIAGVSAFGFSGTNAHVILEAAPVQPPYYNPVERPCQILAISARDAPALRDLTRAYQGYLQTVSGSLADVCYSANAGRTHFAHRLGVVASSGAEMAARLASVAARRSESDVATGRALEQPPSTNLAFLFAGQGSQYPDMGRELYQTQSAFRRALSGCDEILRPILGQSLIECGELDQTIHTQPTLFAVEYALAELWKSWGVQPRWVLGHSLGEYVAACVAGVFSLEDGLKLIVARSRLMQALPPGGEMVTVLASEAEARRALQGFQQRVSIAAVNGPRSVVLSGESSAVRTILGELEGQGIAARRLTVSHAFHSPLMEPMLADFARVAGEVSYHEPRLKLVLNVTGELARAEVATADYWVRHVREAVRFADGMQTLREQGAAAFLEIGPGTTLMEMGRQCLGEESGLWLSSLRRGRSDWEHILGSLAELYVHGAVIDWAGFDRDYVRRKVALPTYPFQRQRHWLPEQTSPRIAEGAAVPHSLLGRRVVSFTQAKGEMLFESQISQSGLPYLSDHCVYGQVLLPAAAYLEMAIEAAQWNRTSTCVAIEHLSIERGLTLAAGSGRILQFLMTPQGPDAYAFRVASTEDQEDPGWTIHASGLLHARSVGPLSAQGLEQCRSGFSETFAADRFYAELADLGIEFGTVFRGVRRLWCKEGAALGEVALESAAEASGYRWHPALLDACLQVSAAVWLGQSPRGVYVPVDIERSEIGSVPPGSALWCHAQLREERGAGEILVFDLEIFRESGEPAAILTGFSVKLASHELHFDEKEWQKWLYEIAWQPREIADPVSASLRSPEEIGELVLPDWAQLAAHPDLAEYATAFAQLEELGVTYITSNMQAMGLSFKPGERWLKSGLANELRVIPRHRPLLERLLGILTEAGILVEDGEYWTVLREPPAASPPAIEETLPARRAGALHGEFRLLCRCGPKLAEVMQGRCDPLNLLFPEGDLSLTNEIYQHSPLQREINRRIGRIVASALERIPADRSIRVIEIGAGTGATTSYVLPLLPPDRTTYTFTDVSQHFNRRAAAKFQAYPWVRYRILDIENAPEAQGFKANGFDIAIAANVLHATQNLDTTLAHVKELLAPGGLLILLEVTEAQRWADLTFGLLDGWWRFVDADPGRAGYPLVNVQRWMHWLHSSGFSSVLPLTADFQQNGASCQYTTFIARVDGFAQAKRSWLLLTDEIGVGRALAEELRHHIAAVKIARLGERFERVDHSTFIVANTPQDVDRLMAEVGIVHGIVHLWSLDAPACPLPLEALKMASRQSCESLLYLIQARLKASSTTPIWFVTRDAQSKSSSGLAQSLIWGMARAVNEEHVDLPLIRIDIDLPENDPASIAKRIAAELQSSDPEAEVALRTDGRHVARLTRFLPPSNSRPLSLQQDCTYLITGGLGGLGLLIAHWMVERGARHLLLNGRSPARDAALASLEQLRHAGADVQVAQVDVADCAALARMISCLDSRLPLKGVVHAAGVLDDGSLQRQTWDRFETVLGPKMWGAWNLHRLTEEMPLDFFILFSSATSLLGNAGQTNHAAANAFLDALAHYRRARGLAAQSINWGAWSSVGAAATRQLEEHLEKKGLGTISPSNGIRALETIIRSGAIQVGVVPVDWGKFDSRPMAEGVRSFFCPTHGEQRTSLATPAAAPSVAVFVEQLASASPQQRRNLVQRFVGETTEAVLGMGRGELTDLHVGFFELGMDSLLSIELKNRLQAGLRCKLPPTLTFDYPNVEKLTQYLAVEVIDKLLNDGRAKKGPVVGRAREEQCAAPEEATDRLSFQTITELLEDQVDRPAD